MESTHVQNMVLSEEAEEKPRSPAQSVCLRVGSLLKDGTLTQYVLYEILHAAKEELLVFFLGAL